MAMPKRDAKGRFVSGGGGGVFGFSFGGSASKKLDTKKIEAAASRAQFENLRHAGFRISKDAKASIKKSKEPSDKGEPPTTRGKGGHNLRGAIFVDSEKDSVIIGPRASFVGDAGEAHEFGKTRKGDQFDERPFMGPALAENVDRFASDWHGSIGE
jgi:hypothetical protein